MCEDGLDISSGRCFEQEHKWLLKPATAGWFVWPEAHLALRKRAYIIIRILKGVHMCSLNLEKGA